MDVQHYDVLTEQDFREDEEWRFSPILTATNRERFDLTEIQAIQYAKSKKTHVVRWKNEFFSWSVLHSWMVKHLSLFLI